MKTKNYFSKFKTNLPKRICNHCQKRAVVFLGLMTFSLTNAQAPGGVTIGLRNWLKADVGTSSTTDNTKISSWNDQSGNTNNFTMATATYQPWYYAATSSNFNFNPTIDFSNGQALYAVSQNLGTGTTAKIDAFFVATSENTSGYNGLGFAGQRGGGSGFSVNAYGSATSKLSVSKNTGDVLDSSSPFQGNVPVIAFGRYTGPGMASGINNESLTVSNTSSNITNQTLRIGEGGLDGEFFDGKIAEIVYYNTNLSAIDKSKVHTYLAVKYGITLNQTTANNYLSSDGSVIWDATSNATYKNNITAIGRDDLSALAQKQSKSVNTTGLVTIAKASLSATNALNTATFAADKDFLILGDDNGALTAFTATGAPTNRKIVSRIWKVQETGTDATDYTIQVPDDSATLTTKLPTETSNVYLLQDSDGDFTSGAIETLMTLSGTNWQVNNIDLDNGQYFTFATDNALSTIEFDDVKLSIYPNPFSTKFNIMTNGKVFIRIIDILGQEIVNKTIDESSEIDMSTYSSKIYFVKFTTENNQIKTYKIIKE